jgi:type II secretory pathway pseudopilin PulG
MVSRRAPQRGVSYLALLLAVAITNGALATGAGVWSQWQRRERETQLLWAGDQIRRAIVAYAQAGTERDAGFPRSLQDLLLDSRTPVPRRFLRQIYEDPMARNFDWGLLRDPQGRLVGVYSRASGVPVKQARFAPQYAEFEGATSYAGWRFAAVALAAAPSRPAATPAARPASAAERGAPATERLAPGRAPPALIAEPAPQTPQPPDAEPPSDEAQPPPEPEPEA